MVGYDIVTEELYVDRTQSGRDDFSPSFSGVHRAPLEPRDGKLRIEVLLDWSSVEVFGGAREAVITDLIFHDPDSDGVELFFDGGPARLDKLTLRRLGSYRD